MNTLSCALALQAQLDTANERIRQLESGEELSRLRAENEALRATLKLVGEERGRLEIDLKGLRAEWSEHD